MNCNNCGAWNSDDAQYCSQCGSALNTTKPVGTANGINVVGLISSVVLLASAFLPLFSVNVFGTKVNASLIDGTDWIIIVLLAANGKPLTHNTIRDMLHNRRYIGEYSFRETVLPDCILAIVPKDLIDRVKERLERNKKPLLTPKFVHSWIQRFTTKEKQSHHAAALLSCVVSL